MKVVYLKSYRYLFLILNLKSKYLTLDDVWGHEGGRVIIALEVALRQVALDLKAEQVAGVLLLQLTRVRDVELHHEPQQRLTCTQTYLLVHWLVSIQPVLKQIIIIYQIGSFFQFFQYIVDSPLLLCYHCIPGQNNLSPRDWAAYRPAQIEFLHSLWTEKIKYIKI